MNLVLITFDYSLLKAMASSRSQSFDYTNSDKMHFSRARANSTGSNDSFTLLTAEQSLQEPLPDEDLITGPHSKSASTSFLPGRLETIEEKEAVGSESTDGPPMIPLPPTSTSPSGRFARSSTTVSGMVGIPPSTPNGRGEMITYPGFSNYAPAEPSLKVAGTHYSGPESRLLLVADTTPKPSSTTQPQHQMSSNALLSHQNSTSSTNNNKKPSLGSSLILTQVLISPLSDIPGTRFVLIYLMQRNIITQAVVL